MWFWELVCESADRGWCFVFDRFWGVTATASGGLGVLLIAFLMVTSLSENAEAERTGTLGLTRVGSVLDHTPVVEGATIHQTSAAEINPRLDHLVHQVAWPGTGFPVSPEVHRKLTAPTAPEFLEVSDVPPLEEETPGYLRERVEYDYEQRLSLSFEPFIERAGRRVR